MSELVLRNRYRVLGRLGGGGGGTVYEVEDLRVPGAARPRLALKALLAAPDREGLLRALKQEFRVLATLRHPRIARVHDFGSLPPDCGLPGSAGGPATFFTRDLVPGQDLAAHCQGLPLAEICRVAQRTAEVLDVLHRAGMVHGDLKPQNVIVDPRAQPHLIDFGLVHPEGAEGVSVGTAAFLAPEIICQRPVDRRVDLYALGITLFRLVSGQLPLAEAGLSELVAWHLEGPPLRLRGQPGVPQELDRVVFRLTQRDPDQRYPSAAEVAHALDEAALAAGAAPAPPRARVFVAPAPGEVLAAPLLELEAAARARLLAGQGGPAVLAVEGGPGSGKSTLLRELAWRCQLAGVEVFRAAFVAGDPRPYGQWSDLLAQVAGLVGQPHPLAATAPGGAEGGAHALHQRLCDYLARCAEQAPLLLLLDDLQEADPESLAAIRFLAHTLPASRRVLLVLGLREGDDQLSRALGSPPARRLQSLRGPEVERMLADASGRRDPQLGQQIQAHTAGNPLFVVQVLRALSEAGWPASPDLARLAPPRGLEQLHAHRWQQLSAEERLVLELLAVLGRPVSGQLLAQAAQLLAQAAQRPAPGDAAAGLPLEPLEQAGWIQRSAEGLVAFAQGPAARAVYSALGQRRRAELHRAAARALERGGQVDPVERTRHAVGAGDLELALQGLDPALEALEGLGARRGAVQLCEGVLRLLPADHPRRPRLRLRLGQLLAGLGDLARAAEELSAALEGAGDSLRVRASLELAAVQRASGQAEQALELLGSLQQPPLADPARQLAVLSEVAAVQLSLEQHEQVLETCGQALALLDSAGQGEPDRLARAEQRSRMAWSLGMLERHDQAASAFEAALEDARAAGDPRVQANILNNWAGVALRLADYDQALELYEQARRCALQTFDVARVATIHYNVALAQLWQGQYAPCLGQLGESMRLFEAMGARVNLARTRSGLGQLQLQLGLYEQARDSLRRAVEEFEQVGPRLGQAAAMTLLAMVQARRGHMDRARAGIARAREIYAELGLSRDAADALMDLSQMELEAGELQPAREALERAGGEVDLLQVRDLRVRAAALRARLATHGGDAHSRDQAARELAGALEDARQQGLLERIWECEAAAAQLADARGLAQEAAVHARAALQILERMAEGLPPEVQSAFWQDLRRREVRRRAELAPTPTTTRYPQMDHTPGPGPQAVEERLYRLLEIYRQVNSELDPERLLGLVMDNAVELTGAERGFLLLGTSPEDLQVEVARNLNLEGEQGAYSRSIADRVFTGGQPVITVSARNDPRFKEYLSVHQLQLESVLCIPIHARGQTVGVLYMESRFQSGRFTPADQRLLMAFGDQVAIALTNARLLADNIRKASELSQARDEIEALAEERGRLLNKRTRQLEEAQRDLAETRRRLEPHSGRFGMVGRSAAMNSLFSLLERVSAADVPVLIEGDSGTGKEMVARAIHGNSRRRKKKLVSVNCAAIPEGLLESELFGHVRGAFTGADRDRKGLFAAADEGTLFLDEIGDMPARMQVDLLRALQEKTVRPVGAHKDLQVDVRVIAASNRPLDQLVQQGRFREDLFYRLKVVTLELPPLRQRADDIPLLADHFLERIAAQMKTGKRRLTRGALRRLMEYGWPGNVRQLEHALMNAAVLADGELLDAEDFTLEAPPGAASLPPVSAPATPEGRRSRDRSQILEALEACDWNKSKAARMLGIPRRTFYRRLAAHGIK